MMLFSSYPPTYADELVRSRNVSSISLPIHTAESDIFITTTTNECDQMHSSSAAAASIMISSLSYRKSSKAGWLCRHESRELDKQEEYSYRTTTTTTTSYYHKTKRHQRKVQWQYNLQMSKEEQ